VLMTGSAVFACVACLSMFGCGGGSSSDNDGGGGRGANGGTGTSSGLSRAATVKSLTPAQAGTLCDWQSGKQGGYGRSVDCADGSTQTTDPDKTMCVSAVSAVGSLCPTLTVGDVEDCANASQTDLCSFETQAGCANVRACIGP